MEGAEGRRWAGQGCWTARPAVAHATCPVPRPPAPAPQVQLEDDMQRAYHSWLAWAIDMSCFVIIGLFYLLATVLIFVAGKAREPDLCERTGAVGCTSGVVMGRRVL